MSFTVVLPLLSGYRNQRDRMFLAAHLAIDCIAFNVSSTRIIKGLECGEIPAVSAVGDLLFDLRDAVFLTDTVFARPVVTPAQDKRVHQSVPRNATKTCPG